MIIGSDVRSGANAEYGGEIEGERPDTLLIAHISPNHDGAILVNLPRDSIVDMPACEPTGIARAWKRTAACSTPR